MCDRVRGSTPGVGKSISVYNHPGQLSLAILPGVKADMNQLGGYNSTVSFLESCLHTIWRQGVKVFHHHAIREHKVDFAWDPRIIFPAKLTRLLLS